MHLQCGSQLSVDASSEQALQENWNCDDMDSHSMGQEVEGICVSSAALKLGA